MFIFFMGLILGCSLGIVFAALLVKSKEIDELGCEVIREAPVMGKDNFVASR